MSWVQDHTSSGGGLFGSSSEFGSLFEAPTSVSSSQSSQSTESYFDSLYKNPFNDKVGSLDDPSYQSYSDNTQGYNNSIGADSADDNSMISLGSLW